MILVLYEYNKNICENVEVVVEVYSCTTRFMLLLRRSLILLHKVGVQNNLKQYYHIIMCIRQRKLILLQYTFVKTFEIMNICANVRNLCDME